MNYALLSLEGTIIGRIDDDGKQRVSFLAGADGPYQAEYKAWLKEGNTPKPAPAPTPTPPEPTINEKLNRIGLTPQDLVAVLEGASGVTIADIKRATAQAKRDTIV